MSSSAASERRGGRVHSVDDFVRGLAWSRDGRQLAAGTAGGRLWLFSRDPAVAPRSWAAHRGAVTGVGWLEGQPRLVSSGEDGKVRIWSAGADQPEFESPGAAGWIEHLAISPDSGHVATASGRVLRIWGAQGDLVREIGPFSSSVTGLAWSGDSRKVATAGYGGVTLNSLEHTAPSEVLAWKASFISAVWSRDGRHLAAATQESTVAYWRLPFDGQEPLHMSGYVSKVTALGWDGSSRYLATGGGDVVTVWDVSGTGPAGSTPVQLEGHEARVSSLAWAHAADALVSGAQDGSVWAWRPGKGVRGVKMPGAAGEIRCLAWSPDDLALGVGSADGTVRMVG